MVCCLIGKTYIKDMENQNGGKTSISLVFYSGVGFYSSYFEQYRFSCLCPEVLHRLHGVTHPPDADLVVSRTAGC